MITGLGVDIIEISRIKEAIEKNNRFLTKIFTPGEIDYYQAKGSKYETLAGNFAAKEAVAKVFGTGIRDFDWKDIEVLRDPLGRPLVKLHNNAKVVSQRNNIAEIHISISHCKTYAVANAIGTLK